MATTLYCWQCKREKPMLDADEWMRIEPLLIERVMDIQRFRQANGASLSEALSQNFGREALVLYREMTGAIESDPEILRHHRIDLLGPACETCEKPLRTPKASFCAECGAGRS
jgi:hypothetical protein